MSEVIDYDDDGEIIEHRHHRHKHRKRIKQKIRVKKTSSRFTKKAKNIFKYIMWTIIIGLFILSIFLLASELNKSGVIKDRRNKTDYSPLKINSRQPHYSSALCIQYISIFTS